MTVRRTVVPLAAALAAVLGVPAESAADVPQRVSFAARLTEVGAPMTGAHDFDFALWTQPTGGAMLWGESLAGVQVNGGFVDVELGTIGSLAGVFSGAVLYLEVTVDGTPLSPRVTIDSAPYAINAGALDGVDADGWQKRVASPCPAGEAMTGISAAGVPSCAAVPTQGIVDIVTQSWGGLTIGGSTTKNINLMVCEYGQILRYSWLIGWACDESYRLAQGGGIAAVNNFGVEEIGLMSCADNEVLRPFGGQWGCSTAVYAVTATATGGLVSSGNIYSVPQVGPKTCSTANPIMRYTGSGWDCGADNNTAGAGHGNETGLGSGTLTSTALTLAQKTADFPGSGMAMITAQVQWNNPSSGGSTRINCSLRDNGAVIKSFFWDPGDADNITDELTEITVPRSASAGSHVFTLSCNTPSATMSAGYSNPYMMVTYFPNVI
jgi:hypothetical protein